MGQKKWALLKSVAGLCLAVVAIALLVHHLRQYRAQDIWQAMRAIPATALLTAMGLVGIHFLAIIQYDVFALRWLRKPLAYRHVALAGFIGNVFGRTIGLPILTSGGVRYRLYHAWGFSKAQIGQLVTFHFASLWLGFMAAAGVSLALSPIEIPSTWAGSLPSLKAIGWILILVVVGYLILSGTRRRPFQIFGHPVPAPSLALAMGQVGVSVTKWLLDAAILYVLLVSGVQVRFFSFAAIFFAAQMVSIFSQAPGGVGVFEAGLMVLLADQFPGPTLAGTLLVYRALYNLLPMTVAVPLYLVEESRLRRKRS